MLVLGILCIVFGFLLAIPILYTLGIILAVIGAVLLAAAYLGHGVGGRHYY